MTTDPLVVTHILSLEGATPERVVAVLAATQRIKDVLPKAAGRFLVTYDLRELRLDGVEKVAAQAGAKPSAGIINTLRRQWIRFTDDNLAANISAPVSPCCNRPPDGKA